jgi:hypothetical protein
LCFFLVVPEAPCLLAGFLAVGFLTEVGFEAALFDALLFAFAGAGAGAVALAAGGDGAGPVSAGDWDWALADDKKPRQTREKNPAKTATAKRRTQTLPSAESWHP